MLLKILCLACCLLVAIVSAGGKSIDELRRKDPRLAEVLEKLDKAFLERKGTARRTDATSTTKNFGTRLEITPVAIEQGTEEQPLLPIVPFGSRLESTSFATRQDTSSGASTSGAPLRPQPFHVRRQDQPYTKGYYESALYRSDPSRGLRYPVAGQLTSVALTSRSSRDGGRILSSFGGTQVSRPSVRLGETQFTAGPDGQPLRSLLTTSGISRSSESLDGTSLLGQKEVVPLEESAAGLGSPSIYGQQGQLSGGSAFGQLQRSSLSQPNIGEPEPSGRSAFAQLERSSLNQQVETPLGQLSGGSVIGQFERVSLAEQGVGPLGQVGGGSDIGQIERSSLIQQGISPLGQLSRGSAIGQLRRSSLTQQGQLTGGSPVVLLETSSLTQQGASPIGQLSGGFAAGKFEKSSLTQQGLLGGESPIGQLERASLVQQGVGPLVQLSGGPAIGQLRRTSLVQQGISPLKQLGGASVIGQLQRSSLTQVGIAPFGVRTAYGQISGSSPLAPQGIRPLSALGGGQSRGLSSYRHVNSPLGQLGGASANGQLERTSSTQQGIAPFGVRTPYEQIGGSSSLANQGISPLSAFDGGQSRGGVSSYRPDISPIGQLGATLYSPQGINPLGQPGGGFAIEQGRGVSSYGQQGISPLGQLGGGLAIDQSERGLLGQQGISLGQGSASLVGHGGAALVGHGGAPLVGHGGLSALGPLGAVPAFGEPVGLAPLTSSHPARVLPPTPIQRIRAGFSSRSSPPGLQLGSPALDSRSASLGLQSGLPGLASRSSSLGLQSGLPGLASRSTSLGLQSGLPGLASRSSSLGLQSGLPGLASRSSSLGLQSGLPGLASRSSSLGLQSGLPGLASRSSSLGLQSGLPGLASRSSYLGLQSGLPGLSGTIAERRQLSFPSGSPAIQRRQTIVAPGDVPYGGYLSESPLLAGRVPIGLGLAPSSYPLPLALVRPTQVTGASAQVIEPTYPAQPYIFGYEFHTYDGGVVANREEGNEVNFKTGSYSIQSPEGFYRIVDYVADNAGFRANIRTNEPGTDNQSPAATSIQSESTLALANGASPVISGGGPIIPIDRRQTRASSQASSDRILRKEDNSPRK